MKKNLLRLFVFAGFYQISGVFAQQTNSTLLEDGINELDAVIEFDATDDLFILLTSRESTCVHLYTRKDTQYLAKRKAFRRAAKRDIDNTMAL